MPADAWIVAGLFVLGIVVYIVLGRTRLAPVIPNDEFIYGNAAQSVAAGEGLTWRGVSIGQRTIYPYLISPAWMLADGKSAYDIAKAINAVVLCSTVWPTWLIARTVIRGRLALIPPALLLLGLWMETSTKIMTEALAIPAATFCLCFTVLALQRTSRPWLVAALAAAAIGTATRTQLGVLFALIAFAVLADVLRGPRRDWRSRARARGFALILSWTILLVGLIVALGPLRDSLGSYAGVAGSRPPLGQSLHWALDHAVELALLVAVIPFVLAVALLFSRAAWRDQRLGAFLAVFLAALLMLLPIAGWFAAAESDRIIERYIAYLVPIVLVGAVVGAQRASWKAIAGVTITLGAAALAMHDPLAGAGPTFLPGQGEDQAFRWAGRQLLGWKTPADASLGGIAVLILLLGLVGTGVAYARDQGNRVQVGSRRPEVWALVALAALAVVSVSLADQSRRIWSDGHTTSRNALALFGGSVPVLRAPGDAPSTLVAVGASDIEILDLEFFNKDVSEVVAPTRQPVLKAGFGPSCPFAVNPEGRFTKGTRCAGDPRWFAMVGATGDATIPTLRGGGVPRASGVPGVPLVYGPPQLVALRQPLCTGAVCKPAAFQITSARPGVVRLRFQGGQTAHQVGIARQGRPRPAITTLSVNAPSDVPVALPKGGGSFLVQPDWQSNTADNPTLTAITLEQAGGQAIPVN